MNDEPDRHNPADQEPPTADEAELLAALARSDADIAAGRTAPASAVHAEPQAAVDRITFGRLLMAAPISPGDLPARDQTPLRTANFSVRE